MSADTAGDRIVVLGRLGGPFGVAGWLHVSSYSDPPENILNFRVWQLERGREWIEREVEDGRPTHKDVLAKFVGVDSPEKAKELSGALVGVRRAELPELAAGEYYLSDLEGLEVLAGTGEVLGQLKRFEALPAHPVMVIAGERERLVPFVRERILKVDLVARQIVVDWSPDW
jgi:16S rRNA processing protein RimM